MAQAMTIERWALAVPPEQLRQALVDRIRKWPIEMVQLAWEFTEFKEERFIESEIQASRAERRITEQNEAAKSFDKALSAFRARNADATPPTDDEIEALIQAAIKESIIAHA
jgi:hypothetical protein